jgi:hypothetical protein
LAFPPLEFWSRLGVDIPGGFGGVGVVAPRLVPDPSNDFDPVSVPDAEPVVEPKPAERGGDPRPLKRVAEIPFDSLVEI